MKPNKIKYLPLILMGLGSAAAWADTEAAHPEAEQHIELETIQVEGKRQTTAAQPLKGFRNVSDTIIDSQTLKKRGTNIGDALEGELGIHANRYGGGSSAPIIRGQETRRIKILHNNAETLDMSAISPDHAVMVDSVLAKQVEVLRGPSTLLYSSGNSAGVVNVVDNKIPERVPEKGYEGEIGARVSSADKERLADASFTFGIGQNVAVTAEGLFKKSSDYHTADYTLKGQTHNKLADSFADSKSGSIGASWIGSKGHIGVAYTERKDRYGLPTHSHLYDNAYIDIILLNRLIFRKTYLQHYPFLMDETDVDYDNPGITFRHNNSGGGHVHTARDQDHRESDNPHIALKMRRLDVRGEWKQPFAGLESIRFSAGRAKYRHDEKTGVSVDSEFRNKGSNVRVEFVHSPIGRLSGMFGFQSLKQDSRAADPNFLHYRQQHLLHDNSTRNDSFFALERLKWDNLQIDLGARIERQKIAMQYNKFIKWDDEKPPVSLLNPHKETARSIGTAINWFPHDEHKLSLIVSHQERLPSNQELYAHGKHLATNSFDAGNKNLKKERSNNIEIGWAHTGSVFDTQLSAYYNRFQNYIFSETLNDGRGPRSLNDKYPLRVNRYNQSGARFYGVEGQIGWQFAPKHKATLFGDYVRGKLVNLPALPTGYSFRGDILGWAKPDNRNAPRVPAPRLGLRLSSKFDNHLSSELEFYRVFAQNKASKLEQPTQGHNILNAGLGYEGKAGGYRYSAFIKGYNLLNAAAYNHASHLPYLPQPGRGVSLGASVKF